MTSRKVHTFCRLCDPHCALEAVVEDGQIVSLRNDQDHPVHKGFCCHKGIQYLRIHQDSDRLNHPLRRSNSRTQERGEFVQVSWDEAATEIGTKLTDIAQRYGDKAIAVYSGNPAAFSCSFFTNTQALCAGFGTG